MKFTYAALLPCLALLAGCADVIEGRAQNITIQSNPAGASCTLTRAGQLIGKIAQTPDTLYISKTKDDIAITCSKEGYRSAHVTSPSGYPENNWIYILVGGPVGWGIDSATGADDYYATPVMVTLTKE